MRRDTRMTSSQFSSSFLSCEKDIEEILRKLFISSKPYSDYLKKLLVINTQDCLDNNSSSTIQQKIEDMSLAKLRQDGYIKLEPKIEFGEHEEVKSYILISCDNFTPNITNPYYWDLGNYRIRPLKIAGYIDGILNKAKLSGIGTFEFMGCNQLILNDTLSGYTLMYRAVHGNDDKIAAEE